MMCSKIVLFVLLVVNLSRASPIRTETNPSVLIGVPIYMNDRTNVESTLTDDSYPTTYAFFMAPSADRLDPSSDSVDVGKRSAEESELEDLETAAGTNALRPLFVYRQQVAYRQRVREANRRGNRF